MSLQVKVFNEIALIDAGQWNALVQDNNPFLRHEFLSALEVHHCVGKNGAEKFGWLPRHLAIYQDDEMIAAMPLYEKYNSYGEFVFDQSWADAWHQHGLQYFPKLVSSIPYTPALGQRFLVKEGVSTETIFPLFIEALKDVANQLSASGFHILFPHDTQLEWFKEQGLLIRHDCQFYWHNRNYHSFDDFLAQFSSRKRKNIIKERQAVVQAGVTLKRLNGHQASAQDWQKMAHFYERTFKEKWGTATFNYNFFQDIAKQLPDNILLVLAELDGECIAGSLMFSSDSRLYGRFWGCDKTIKGLHFEACYYQGIEHCIEKQLSVFEPGAQGEHKVSRGFVPTMTRSAHFLMQEHFKQSLEQFVEHEKNHVLKYIDEINQHLPYKKVSG